MLDGDNMNNDKYLLDISGLIVTSNTYDPIILGRNKMGAITWDAVGEHYYETGVDRTVLYPVSTTGTYPLGVPWNGVTSISESPSGADANKQYADNINYITLYGVEEVGGTIEAFTYPDEFMACDGSVSAVSGVRIGQQIRQGFGLSYQTKIGNDTIGQDYAYMIHLLYGCRASPAERSYETINDSPEAITFSWEFTTTPVEVTGYDYKPTSIITIDSRHFTDGAALAAFNTFKEILYGRDAQAANPETGTAEVTALVPRLPLPAEVIDLLDLN